jgi:hypothetical protein
MPLPPMRRRRASRPSRWFKWGHDDRRILLHRHGYVDHARVELCCLSIGGASWFPFAGIFGNAHAVLNYMPRYTVRILKFPERRSEIAKLRGEIAEMSRAVSVG